MLKILVAIFFIWVVQILFLSQAAKSGFNGWDDWGLVFTYDAYKANNLSNFPAVAKFLGTPYIWSEAYNTGSLKDMFGLHQTTIKYVELVFKALASFSVAFLVFKLTKNKLFSFLAIFFFVIFPSTAGPLSHIIFIGAYLTIIFICFSVLFYIQSAKKPKKVLLSSFFFFLALLVCPSRAYLILPVPFFAELVRSVKPFKPLRLLKGLFIFYFPLFISQIFLLLNGDRPQSAFMPQLDLLSRFNQVASGNLYTLSLPFQAVSNLFIDLSFVEEILQSTQSLLLGFTIINLILLLLSLCLGLVVKSKKFISFAFRLMGLTILVEVIFYLFGRLSLHNGQISYVSVIKWLGAYSQSLNPSIFAASLGGFYFVLGLLLTWEWWKHQRDNKVLKVIFFAWLWSISSEVILYLTSHWYDMTSTSIDRYIITCSLGAVVFTAGIFTLCIQSALKIKNFNLKLLSFSLMGAFIILTVWKNYQLLNQFYYTWNEDQGYSADWQDTMYQRFLNKFGKDNLTKSIFLYIDSSQEEAAFNQGSFVSPARFRFFYDNNGKLIRDNCKAVTTDIKVLKNSFTIQDGEKGFTLESICVKPIVEYEMRTNFYPLSNFYAYRMKGKDFLDIKNEIISQLPF